MVLLECSTFCERPSCKIRVELGPALEKLHKLEAARGASQKWGGDRISLQLHRRLNKARSASVCPLNL
ncbi:MAG: hypothetical protein KME46_09185 [Brasilonema angustatum HA4187-MV1]|jgi:hypothetical protein|nr:hypothetical protein [Brasilonema angustatum HA4187-MV1]